MKLAQILIEICTVGALTALPDHLLVLLVFFLTLIRFSSVYRHSHLPINGDTAAVAYAAVTAVTTNADSGVPLERIASLEETYQESQKTARRTFH